MKVCKNIFLICAVFFLCDFKPRSVSIADKKPNIVYILVDQWRAQAGGYAGDPNAHTPNIDRLAGVSLNVRNAVSGMPVCSPHRASLMSGQYPLTHGVFMNDVLLDTNAVTLGKVYAQNGYDTGFIGKWHIDGHGRRSYIPATRHQGFEYWKALECTHNYNHSEYYIGNDPERKVWDGYDVTEQSSDAITYIRKHAYQDEPFVLFVSMGAPHDPYQTAPEKYRKMFEDKKIILRENVPAGKREKAIETLRGYYAHMAAIDDNVGEIWKALTDTKIEENTIFVFTADHGDLLGSHGWWNKQQPYNESIRVPFLMHYPKAFGTKGSVSDILLNTPDIMPTLLGLSNVAAPRSMEGIDYSEVLRGKQKSGVTETLISCVQPFGQWPRSRGGKEYRGIVTQRYTYTRDLNGPWQLFDNEKDPFQLNNLVGNSEHKGLQASLDGRLSKLLRERNDKFLPGLEYVKKWNYVIDETETVPYRDMNYEGKPLVED
ncbi:sulfatase family protein [Persicitalea jodogahamensis]|uniref:Sulfatase n=1 Tax=Persicitalea jodogahamensis TaxID=402147 RepID=A0A8J3DBL5_9BACT|nr:sulfatase [Persicitalea jodogahamensis]GHB80038.1 sulfatase [Persicitalea jodogahamensis]